MPARYKKIMSGQLFSTTYRNQFQSSVSKHFSAGTCLKILPLALVDLSYTWTVFTFITGNCC